MYIWLFKPELNGLKTVKKKYLKKPTNALGFMNVILLHTYHRHVSATHVAIFRVLRKIT